jgi:hypothetical protein
VAYVPLAAPVAISRQPGQDDWIGPNYFTLRRIQLAPVRRLGAVVRLTGWASQEVVWSHTLALHPLAPFEVALPGK